MIIRQNYLDKIEKMANTAYVARRGRSQEELYAVLKGLSEILQ